MLEVWGFAKIGRGMNGRREEMGLKRNWFDE